MSDGLKLLSCVASVDTGEYMVTVYTPLPLSAYTTMQLANSTDVLYAYQTASSLKLMTTNTYLFMTHMSQGSGESSPATKINLSDAVHIKYFLTASPSTALSTAATIPRLYANNSISAVVYKPTKKSLQFTFNLDSSYQPISSYKILVSLINTANGNITNLPQAKTKQKTAVLYNVTVALTPAQVSLITAAAGSYSIITFPVINPTTVIYGPFAMSASLQATRLVTKSFVNGKSKPKRVGYGFVKFI